MSLVYVLHSFHCLINKTVNHINFSLLIICLSMSHVNFINKYFIKNKTVTIGKQLYVWTKHGNNHMSHDNIKGNRSIVTYDTNLTFYGFFRPK